MDYFQDRQISEYFIEFLRIIRSSTIVKGIEKSGKKIFLKQ